MNSKEFVTIGKVWEITYPLSGQIEGQYCEFIFSAPNCDHDFFTFCPMAEGEYLMAFGGNIPPIKVGRMYKITGRWVDCSIPTPLAEVLSIEEHEPFNGIDEQRKFFEYAFGEQITEQLINTFSNPVDIFEARDKKALMTIKGIGPATAERLIRKFNEYRGRARIYIDLYEYGLTENMVKRLLGTYETPDAVVKQIKQNPYQLIDDVQGIGWVKADAIARMSGLDMNSPYRIKSFLKHYFHKVADEDGHVWHDIDSIIEAVHEIAPELSNTSLLKYVKEMIESNEVHYDKETRRIGGQYYYKTEASIAQNLHRLQKSPARTCKNVDKIIRECEREVGFEYSEEQVNAIHTILDNNVTILTARAGAGKTSLMYPVTKILRENGYKEINLCALSGKAALNLSEVTGVEGQTIHRLLGYDGQRYLFNASCRLDSDVIIVDEISMVGGDLLNRLLNATPTGCKVIFVGDMGQLESIGFSNCGKDMVESGVIPHVHLTKIFRQALKSGIIKVSSDVYDGHLINKVVQQDEIIGELKDFHLITVGDAKQCVERVIENFKNIHFGEHVPIEDILIGVAKRSIGDCSARVINKMIQNLLTYKDKGLVVTYTDTIKYSICYHVGDRVLLTKNMYYTPTVKGRPISIFNGNIGTILKIDYYKDEITIRFPQGDAVIDYREMINFQLGYAITVHKLQGIGIPYMIYVCDPNAYTLISKEHLYTGITRARKHCICISTPHTLRRAVETTRVYKKRTWLTELLREEFGGENDRT